MELSVEGKRTLARYADRGWLDAAGDPRLTALRPRSSVPAYVVLASGMSISLGLEVQVTQYPRRMFRGRSLIVLSAATRDFDLLDLKVGNYSHYRRAEALHLRDCGDESTPELIQWPLGICSVGESISVCAISPEAPGIFEIALLGEVLA